MKSSSVRYFPFSPGIPWQVKNGKYVQPEVSGAVLRSLLKDKEIVVSAFGGLLESFFSLSILEIVNYMLPGSDLLWCGNSEYYSLVKQNGLAKTFDRIDQSVLDRFPVPVFFDKENRAYFNCLNNYLTVNSYYLTFGYEDRRIAVKQIVEKSTASWDVRFIPQLRRPRRAQEPFLAKGRAPYVLIFPDRTGLSERPLRGMDWDVRRVRAFCTMLQPEFRPILVVKRPELYFNISAEIIPFTLDDLLSLLPRAYAVLSKDIDVLFLALAISKSKIISLPTEGPFDLYENAKFLISGNDIYTTENLSPERVWKYIKS